MSVTVNNGPIQDYVHPDDHAELTNEITPGFNLSQFLSHIPFRSRVHTAMCSVARVDLYSN